MQIYIYLYIYIWICRERERERERERARKKERERERERVVVLLASYLTHFLHFASLKSGKRKFVRSGAWKDAVNLGHVRLSFSFFVGD
jgi:hypothetical protein